MAMNRRNDPQTSMQIPEEEEIPLRHPMEEDTDILKERQSFVNEEEKGIQSTNGCTHPGNAGFEASTEYSGGYSAIHAFQRLCYSWSSAWINADDSEKQWIGMRLKGPRKVYKISFRGSHKYPDNTPTNYELRAFDTETQKWERIMSGSHPKSNPHKQRTHYIKREKTEEFYQDFRLFVKQTIWMEKGLQSGYVQLSNVELCWDTDATAPPSISKPSKLEADRKNDADEHSKSRPIDESASTTSPLKTLNGAETPDADRRTMDEDGASPAYTSQVSTFIS